MPFKRTIRQLGSRIARSRIGNNGVRRLRPFGAIQQQQQGGGILGALARGAGWLWNGLKGIAGVLGWTLSTFWDWVTNAASFIWNFNWNITEEQIEQEAQAAWNQLGANLGGLTGQTLGWAACGALPGMVVATFNPALGAHILKEVGEEAFEEIAGTLKSVVNQTAQNYSRIAFLKLYSSARKMIELGKGKQIKDKDRKPWSLALKWDEYIDSIDNTFVRNFLEEAREEFADSCSEAGFVVLNSIESYFAVQTRAQIAAAGPTRTVEIELNRRD